MEQFLIAPLNVHGLVTALKPWLIPDDAFSVLKNAYVFRGRVRKRWGALPLNPLATVPQLNTRLRANIGTTPGPINIPGDGLAEGQMFSVGNDMFTVYQLGAGVATYTTSGTITATIDSTASPNTVTFAGDAGSDVWYYPSTPVMGFARYETTNYLTAPTIAFDQNFAYQYDLISNAWLRLSAENAAGDATWTGTDYNFFWTCNWTTDGSDHLLFVTNFNSVEPNYMRYWDGSKWYSFEPSIQTNPPSTTVINLLSARLLIPFHGRLLALNTYELEGATTVHYPTRIRWSQIGSPTASDAWVQDVKGKGSGINLSTNEHIISAQFVKDRLIIFCERSTWELAYTGNQATPFKAYKLNAELGAESTFSVVPFDRVVLGIGNRGIHACNGSNVERIDTAIPQKIFDINSVNEGTIRTCGIRDYYTECVYWSYPNRDANHSDPTYPTQILSYNYRTNTWALHDDSITAFGYIEDQQDITVTSLDSQFENVICGNQEGFTFVVSPDATTNSISLQITDYANNTDVITLTIYNHNLSIGQYIKLNSLSFSSGVNVFENIVYQVQSVPDADTITINQTLAPATGAYLGGGNVTLVSQIDIITKQYNFYQDAGKNCFVQKVDFLIDATTNGAAIINFYDSTSSLNMYSEGVTSGSQLGTNTLDMTPYSLYPLEATQDRLWHPFYVQASGETVQLEITLSDSQMTTTNIVESDFQLHALLFYAQPVARLQ